MSATDERTEGSVETVGQRIRRMRTERGWSQDQLARKAEIGQSVLCRIEREKQGAGQGTLARLAGAFGVDPTDIDPDARKRGRGRTGPGRDPGLPRPHADVGSRIQRLLDERGMTQSELAEAVGVSRPYITMIAGGRAPGSVKVLTQVAEALGVPAGALFADAPAPVSDHPSPASDPNTVTVAIAVADLADAAEDRARARLPGLGERVSVEVDGGTVRVTFALPEVE